MEIWDELMRYFSQAGSTRRTVMLGATLLGISSGALGSFALLRRQSLMSDAMAHAALPGVCLAFIITGQKSALSLLIGATITGLLAAMAILTITRNSRIKEDTAIGLCLSIFFGVGITLLTNIQKHGTAGQAGLDKFLFGKAASLMERDIYLMAIMCFVLISLVVLFFKEFKILSFDPDFGASLGLPIRFLDYFLTTLVVIAVMVGLQTVGVVLMVAMLILPAATARQWTDQLAVMVTLSSLTGAMSGIVGSVFSAWAPKVPTGPVMALTCSFFLFVSILIAPRRGIIPRKLRHKKNKNKVQRENILKTTYQTHSEKKLSPEILQNLLAQSRRHIRLLRKQGLIAAENPVTLTEAGNTQAQKIVRKHRLWELYLSKHMDIASDHVHRDAEEIEHILSAEIVKQLEETLQSPQTCAHGTPIPER